MNHPPKILWILSGISAVMAVAVFAWFGYFSEFFLSPFGSGNAASHSALLPAGWETYRADDWNVGYPSDYEVHIGDNAVVRFLPSGVSATDRRIYFSVARERMTLAAYRIARKADGDLPPEDVTIANYPAAKYMVGGSLGMYAIAYHNETIVVASDNFTDETIAIMFATFVLNTGE